MKNINEYIKESKHSFRIKSHLKKDNRTLIEKIIDILSSTFPINEFNNYNIDEFITEDNVVIWEWSGFKLPGYLYDTLDKDFSDKLDVSSKTQYLPSLMKVVWEFDKDTLVELFINNKNNQDIIESVVVSDNIYKELMKII